MSETRDPNQLMDAAPDIAPLAWVIDEIRTSLNDAVGGVKTFLGAKQDLDSLRNARNQVHQANGALQLLDLRGVALVTEAVEQLLRRWEADPKDCLPAAVRTIETALAAVIAYLEGLLSGRPNQPIRLYPYYREVLQLNRALRVHPADLIFPDLSRRPAFHQIEVRPMTADQLRVRRVRFEEGLLGFLRDSEDARARRMMRDALADLERLPQRGLARSFWWIVRGLLDALDSHAIAVDVDLKRVLARLNLQLRRLIEGGGAVAERLMIDALYYVGRADEKVARVAEVKRLYGLDALIPADFERATLTAIDADAMRSLKEALAQTKNLWGQIVGAGATDVAKFAHELHLARDAAARLEAYPIAGVLETIAGVTGEFPRLATNVREALGLEVASALLFVELGIDELPQVEPEYEARAKAVIERLRAAFNNRPLPDSAPWLSELARRAQDRLTMGTVVAETQATLREIEQRLDRFFRTPTERGELAATDAMFDQVCGVLSVLGHEEPMAALRNVQQSVRAFANPAQPVDATEFPRVAQNLGAIGFFVESLTQDADRPRGIFRYDPATGVFSADLGQTPAAETVPPPDDEFLAPPRTLDTRVEPPKRAENVETLARQHVAAARHIAQRLAQTPHDANLLHELARVVLALTNEADLLDDAQLKGKTQQTAQLMARFKQTPTPEIARQIAQLLAPPEAPAAPPPTAPLPSTQAAADRELHQIFVEEANEVLDGISSQLEALRGAPDDAATLTTVRRAFHTLKGSSRMVGLKTFGEGAWAVEQCFNLWLAQERAASDDLIALAAKAHELMRGWIGRIASDPQAEIDVGPLVRAAQRVREGGAFEFDGGAGPAGAAAPAQKAAPPPKTSGSAADKAPPALPKAETGGASTQGEADRAAPTRGAAEAQPEVIEVKPLDEAAASAPGFDEDVRRIGPVEISHGLYSVFLNEADECIRTLAQDVSEWRFEANRGVSQNTIRRAHSLAGIAATVGLTPVWAIADPLDDLMHELGRSNGGAAVALSATQFDALERAIERMRGMLHQFAAGVFPDAAPLEAAAVQELLAYARTHAAAHAEPAAHEERASLTLVAPLPPAEEIETGPLPAPLVEEISVPALEAEPGEALVQPDKRPASTVRDELDPDLLHVFLAEANDLLPAIGGNLRALAANPNDREVARTLMRQLHTAKGSARMAGAMRLGELVHEMETRIESAMQLVNVPPVIVEDLQGQYDEAVALYEELQHPDAVARSAARAASAPAPAPAPAKAPAAAPSPAPTAAPLAPVINLASARPVEPPREVAPPAPARPAAAAAAAMATPQVASFIRVRADVLDKLVDQAGEVSIARSKLENEVGTLKAALTDLTENIQRLRGQLREVEIQADAQIQARADQLSKESAAFDPLEFDRYTRLQELTRLLAESVEDVAMVQANMLKGLSMADSDLTSQSRLTRELQQQLMRVRLVPFANLSERLYRVARQTAKELDKRVNLEVRGGNVEIDRGVLERMGGPFEHLVRNSIVHGLETPAERLAAGKRETGEITIEVRQEGNEIIVVVADDGAGLNFERIRARALAKGLISPQQHASDRELMELIFAPGFSTATEVTELAGRGVGMDVVRAELGSFGGRVAVASERGRGTRFTLYLPLTLAVTQVVLATVGGRRYAIPAGMVEQVRRYKPALISAALADGVIDIAPVGQVVLRPLAQLLGVEVTLHHAKQTPVVLLRSGDDRLAVSVDDVSTNQEVVVKNVGAQVSRLAGILGATILGNGEIVLIVNPVQLITRAPEPPALYAAPGRATAAEEARRAGERVAAADEPEAPALVMVVDDSLTVRRVTQRLLERNGYEVMLAKDGVDALRQLQDARPDIMLVDIEMPRMDGFDLTRNVRASRETRDIPIFMITSRTAEKHRGMALEIGVNEYLGKPYQEEELLRLIRRYLAERATA
jgi:chemosensory pili system protein ChpA (sensor histidine kinase/response regulator)